MGSKNSTHYRKENHLGAVVKLADALHSGCSELRLVRVRLPPAPPLYRERNDAQYYESLERIEKFEKQV